LLLGVLALTSLLSAAYPPQQIAGFLPQTGLLAPVMGAAAGAVAAGHPVTSYVLAGELSAAGVSLAAVTALIVSWVSVGVVHMAAEASMLGTRFALWRNAISFVFAIAIGHVVATMVAWTA
jgi:uncharacterized membrane protein YraQ (UPF0718 family)